MNLWKELRRTWNLAFNTKTYTVDSVIDTGEYDEVFDMEMPNHHNFFANGLLVHNCHMVDWQDAISEAPETQYGKIIKHFSTINPKMRVIGYTGSPFRGVDSIKGKFWKHQLTDISTMELISLGFLVPPVFGFGDKEHHYDLSEFKLGGDSGCQDFTAKELQAMGRKLTKDTTMTQEIMEQVKQIAADRSGVLITCASKKHCQQVADCLPEGSWGIVTDDTSTKARKKILDAAKAGEIKYVIQIGCLTTGVNIPLWDTCVILRKIGSLTLLIQLIGRVLRLLKPEQEKAGILKSDALVLDYTDTLEAMGDIYDDPIIQQAAIQKKLADNKQDLIECPECGELNNKLARRCCGVSNGQRCEHFWLFRDCKSCGCRNDVTAKDCRQCNATLIDPNANLVGKAYTDADFKKVNRIEVKPGKGDALIVRYHLDSTIWIDGEEFPEVAVEILHPITKDDRIKRGIWSAWVQRHCHWPDVKQRLFAVKDLTQLADTMLNQCAWPDEITHRVNSKGFSIINRKSFHGIREHA